MSTPTHRLRVGDESYLITVERHGGRFLVSREDGTGTESRLLYRSGARVLLESAGRQVEGFVRKHGAHVTICFDGHQYIMEERPIQEEARAAGGMKLLIESPMTGTVREVKVKVGDLVEQGLHLITVEAMKMEHRLVADGPGVVAEILAHVEERVDMGQLLLRLAPPGASE